MVNFFIQLPVIFQIVSATLFVSLVAFSGIMLLILRAEAARKLSPYFISFAAGSLLGVTFLDILPEVSEGGVTNIFWYVLLGILIFFILEKFFVWYHCHGTECVVHTQQAAPLILVGDAIHNFIDGVIIASAFLVDFNLGIVTTLAVIFHEIPQEIGDFSILLHSGIGKVKALILNFFVALPIVAAAVLTYFFQDLFLESIGVLLAFVAGHFIYIATADLIPELHKETGFKKSAFQILLLISGVMTIWLVGEILPH